VVVIRSAGIPVYAKYRILLVQFLKCMWGGGMREVEREERSCYYTVVA